MIRFDAYTATTSAMKPGDALGLLCGVLGPTNVDLKQGKGFHQFAERVAVRDDTGTEVGAFQWGGRHGDLLMIEVKGEHTPEAVERLRSHFPHRVTRVDSCADFDAPGAFQRLYRACRTVKKAHRIIGGKAGDWEDFPEKGRTLYLGAKSSTTRTRLYEKGKQAEYAHLSREDWVRLEVQVRPVKEAKEAYSSLSAEQVWGASRWTRDLASMVLQAHVDPHPAGSTYRKTDDERALEWMCRQYGTRLVSLAGDLGGWAELGLTMREVVMEQQRLKQQGR